MHCKIVFLHVTWPDHWSRKALESWLNLSSQTLWQPAGTCLWPWEMQYPKWQSPLRLRKVLWEAGSRQRESMLLTGTRNLPFKWNFCDFHEGLWGPFTSGTVFLTFSSQPPRAPKYTSSVISSRNLLCPTPHPFPFSPYPQAELTAETQLFIGACDNGLCPSPFTTGPWLIRTPPESSGHLCLPAHI